MDMNMMAFVFEISASEILSMLLYVNGGVLVCFEYPMRYIKVEITLLNKWYYIDFFMYYSSFESVNKSLKVFFL